MSRERKRNLVFGVSCGALLALSPLTPSPLGANPYVPLFAGLAAALLGTVAAQYVLPKQVSTGAWRARIPVPTVALRVALLLWLVLVLPTLGWMYGRWTFSVWRDMHGLFVPVAVVLLVRRTLLQCPEIPLASSNWGWVLIGMSCAFVAPTYGGGPPILGAVGVVVAIPGISLLLLGGQMTRRLWQPFALGLFMIPVPPESGLHEGLQEFTAIATHHGLRVLGYSTLQEGHFLWLGDMRVEISAYCSGFASAIGIAFVALVLASLSDSRSRARWVVATALPIALAINSARVLILILLAYYFGPELLETLLHKGTGAATFLVSVAAVATVAGWQPIRALAGVRQRVRE